MPTSDELNKAAQAFVDNLTGDIIVDSVSDVDNNIIEPSSDSTDENKLNNDDSNVGDSNDKDNENKNRSDSSDVNNDTNHVMNDEKTILSGKKFYINRDTDAHDSTNDIDHLESLITAHGGELLKEVPKDYSVDVVIVSPYNDTKLPTVTPTYIKACVKSTKLLDMQNYLVPYDEFRSVIDTELRTEDEQHGDNNGASQQQQDANDMDIGTQNLDDSKDIKLEGNKAENKDSSEDSKDVDEQMKLFHDNVNAQESGVNTNSDTDGASLVNVEEQGGENNNMISQVDSPDNLVSDNQGYQASRAMLARANLPSHNKASFTEDEDEFILDVVRKNPTRRTTHTLFDEISHYVPNHTGNSIRHRFRVYLSKRLEYVYEVDKYGKLVRDENGGLIKTKVLPPSIKRKFTAEEDYDLGIAVKKQFYRDLYQIDPDTGVSLINSDDSPTAIARRNMTMDPNHVPGQEPTFVEYRTDGRRGPIAREFFKSFAEDHTSHTENAWRDRFRKFLLIYGVDSYIEYYETEIAAGKTPEPMKNMTNRPKRPGVPTPGNYNSAVKKARNNAGSPRASQASQSLSVAAAAAAANDSHMSSSQRTYPIPENELLDEETMNFISTLKNNLTNMDSSLPFEYPQEIADAIRHDFSIEEAEYDNIDPDTIPFPPEIATMELFLPKFFQMSGTREFMQKIDEVISRDYEPSQAEKLVQDLCDEAGVRKTFSTSILTALSGDLMVFPRYFLNSFKHNANPPMNIPGIWTREDDEMLRSGKDEELKVLEKKHGAGRIEMRRRFIEKDLI